MSRITHDNRFKRRDSKTALLFDGVDDYVEIPHNANQLLTDGFTLSAWINPRSFGGGEAGIIFDKSSDSTGGDGFLLRIRSLDKKIQLISNNNIVDSFNSAVFLKKFVNIVATSNADGVSVIYVNGIIASSDNTILDLSGITTTNPLTIGNRSGATDRTFDGIIDEPRIYNRVLSAEEISNMYYNDIVPTDGLVAEYLFDEGTGTTAIDTVGGNNGTISGATYVPGAFHPRVKIGDDGDYALSFNGVDDYVDAPMSFSSGEVSIFVEFKRTKLGTYQHLINKYNVASSTGFQLFIRNTNNITASVNNENTITVNKITDYNWHIVEIVMKEGELTKINLDGIACDYSTREVSVLLTENADNLLIGRRGDAGTFYYGYIKGAKIWKTALTSQQIHDLYYNKIVPEDNLVAEYFRSSSDGSGTSLINTAPKTIGTNDGTLNGPTWVAL